MPKPLITVALLLLLLSGSLLAVSGSAGNPSGRAQAQTERNDTPITGRISDTRTATPIIGATLTVIREDGSQLTTQTDDTGELRLSVPAVRSPYERVTVTIQAQGYGPRTLSGTLLYPGIERRITVTLGNLPIQQTADLPTADSGREPDKRDLPPLDPLTLEQLSQLVPPDTIRVARTGHKECAAWLDAGKPVLRVEVVPFREYVKNVLPNEWIASWHPESLKAGALAAKMYAWRHILIERRKDIGADIVDNTCDQYYVPGSQQASSDAAVDATWAYVLHRNGGLFPIFYLNTRQRCDTSPFQPCMPQWGTQEDAQRGDGWQTIVQRYYGPAELFIPNPTQPNPTREPAQSYSYAYVDQNPISGIPITRITDTAIWELRIRNTGSATWYRNSATQCNIYLGTGEPGIFGNSNPLRDQDHLSPLFAAENAQGWLVGADTSGRRILLREEQVRPGEVGSFRFVVTAPNLSGELRPYFTPLIGGPGCSNSFWLPTQGIFFTAEAFPFSYEVVRRGPAETITLTGTQTFELVLRNTGRATWYRHPDTAGNPGNTTVRLATGMPNPPRDNPFAQPEHRSPFYTAGGPGWLNNRANRIVMQEERVERGQTATFRFAASVPTDPALNDTVIESIFTPYVEERGWMSHQADTRISVRVPTPPALILTPADVTLTPALPSPVTLRMSTGTESANQVFVAVRYNPDLVELVNSDGLTLTGIMLAPDLPRGLEVKADITANGLLTLAITTTTTPLQGTYDITTLYLRMKPALIGAGLPISTALNFDQQGGAQNDIRFAERSLNPALRPAQLTLRTNATQRVYLPFTRRQ